MLRDDTLEMQCERCHATNPDDAGWCNQCFAPFAPSEQDRVSWDVAETPHDTRPLADGPFARTASTTLTRLVAGGPWFYVEPGGEPLAVMHKESLGSGLADMTEAVLGGESLHRLDERHTCLDLDDRALFYVERYRAVDEPSFTVFDPNACPIGTYVSHGKLFADEIEVRDGTSAPVAVMRPGRDERLDLWETGGGHLGFTWREDCDLETEVDDRWGLVVLDEPRLLDRRAVIAAPLVAFLLSRRMPRPKPRPDGRGGVEITLADLNLFG